MSPPHDHRPIRILYLAHRCPYPPHSGDRIRNFHILRHLSQRYAVHLIYPSFSQTEQRQASALERYCASVRTVRLNPVLSKFRAAYGLLTKKPSTLWYFYSRRLQSIINQTSCDIILADCSSMAQYAMHMGQPKIIDFVDVDYDKWLLYAESASFPKSFIYISEYFKLKKYENFVNTTFNHTIVISKHEKLLLTNQNNITVIQNGIDMEISNCNSSQSKPQKLIFSGVMNYYPNIDAVLHFHEHIFPLIKKHTHCQLHFVIAGMNPVKQIKQLAREDVVVTGFVPDMRAYLSRASICVVPLRIAKGLQNKVLEAMAMGVPVVATPIANRGIGARHRQEIMLAESPSAFAEATVALLHDKDLRQKISANAKAFVMKNFRWESNLQKLDEVVMSLTSLSSQE